MYRVSSGQIPPFSPLPNNNRANSFSNVEVPKDLERDVERVSGYTAQ